MEDNLLSLWCYAGVVIVASAALMYFLFSPPPQLSPRLKEWWEGGLKFRHRGMDIFFTDTVGSGSFQPLVCLHGFPTSSFDWYKILPTLQKRYSRIIMPDFLGFGFSDKPQNHTYKIGEQADIIEDLLVNLKIKSAHIFAHDYGDTVALELLARHNKNQLTFELTSLTLTNGGIFPETHHPRISQKLLLLPILGLLISHLFTYRLFRRGFGEVFGEEKPAEKDFRDFWTALRYNNGDKASHKIINFLRERTKFKDRWVGALKMTELNVLMVYGPADPVNPPAFADHFRKVVPHQNLITLSPGIGHYPQWEAPESVLEHLITFTSTCEGKKKKYC